MRSPISHVSISEPTDPSSQWLLYHLICYQLTYPYTVQQNLPGFSHNVTVFSPETGTKGSFGAMVN